jgi:hypothetical protein
VLKKCSRSKGIKRFLLCKDLLTKIKQCDVELSNVLHAFHVRDSLLLLVSIGLTCLVGRVVFGHSRGVDRAEARGMGRTDI